MFMKPTHTLATLVTALCISSCTSTRTQSPVHTAPATPVRAPAKTRATLAAKPEGALRQVSSTPSAHRPKAFPDIPLKEDTGVSPLIHTKTDTPAYKRSTP